MDQQPNGLIASHDDDQGKRPAHAQKPRATPTHHRTNATYENAEALIDGMERHGTKAFLAAQERDTETIRDVTIDQMWLRTTETVVEVRPPALEHQRVDLPAIDWQPPVLPRIRPAQIPKGPAAAKSGDKPFPVRGADAPVGGITPKTSRQTVPVKNQER